MMISTNEEAQPSLRIVTCNTCYGWAHLMLRVMKSESWRRHYKFLWDVPGESSFSMADSKLNESPEMVLLIYRNLFFPNHTIITHETRGEYSIFGETVLFFFQLPGHSHWRILIQSNLSVQPPLASNHLS